MVGQAEIAADFVDDVLDAAAGDVDVQVGAEIEGFQAFDELDAEGFGALRGRGVGGEALGGDGIGDVAVDALAGGDAGLGGGGAGAVVDEEDGATDAAGDAVEGAGEAGELGGAACLAQAAMAAAMAAPWVTKPSRTDW